MTDTEPTATPQPPRRRSTRELAVDLTGMLVCWNGDGVSIIRIISGPLAIVVFSTPELFERGVAALGIPCTRAKCITDGLDFVAGVAESAPEVVVIVDPYLTTEGKLHYLQALPP